MRFLGTATVKKQGQITLPVAVRRQWALKAGESVHLSLSDEGYAVMAKSAQRSILTSRSDLMPLSLGRSVTQADIDEAVASAMAAQELRVRNRRCS
jgi:bifunctional DNA-binding transcriptional regulator/antitoxin component of YhaV-PrlF toxin-antitoxin module